MEVLDVNDSTCERCGCTFQRPAHTIGRPRTKRFPFCDLCWSIVSDGGRLRDERRCPMWRPRPGRRQAIPSGWVRVAHPLPTDACGRRWCVACGTTLADNGRNYHLKRTCSTSCQQVCNRFGWSLGADRACRACSMPFVTDVGRNHRHCSRPTCVAARRDAARTGATVPCRVCGVQFQRGRGKPESCSPEHAKELARERNRRKNRKRRNARQSVGLSERYTLAEVALRDGGRCHLCGLRVNTSLDGMNVKGPTIDHLVPLSCGGDDVMSNVALAHRDCNTRRGVGGLAQLRLAVG